MLCICFKYFIIVNCLGKGMLYLNYYGIGEKCFMIVIGNSVLEKFECGNVKDLFL